MAHLAIKGHATRGQEVIEILKMLGGKNYDNHNGAVEWAYFIDLSFHACHYYIDGDGNIECSHVMGIPFPGTFFTLEEFLEKFPYKVGDRVSSKYLKNYKIEKAEWESHSNKVVYKLQGVGWFSVEDLQLYKEETMEETDTMNHTSEINLNHPVFKGCNEIELIIPNGWEFERRGNKMFGVRKYPKTYEECCELLSLGEDGRLYTKGYKSSLIQDFQKLLVCRDAYWKIAGEQMGLDKPWEPENPTKHYIFTIETCGGVIIKNAITSTWWNRVLVFPTEEMRDAFYENFKDLIEECKEFL